MNAREREQRIGEVPVQVFRGMKYGSIGFNPEIQLEETEVENAPVIHESDDADDGRHE